MVGCGTQLPLVRLGCRELQLQAAGSALALLSVRKAVRKAGSGLQLSPARLVGCTLAPPPARRAERMAGSVLQLLVAERYLRGEPSPSCVE